LFGENSPHENLKTQSSLRFAEHAEKIQDTSGHTAGCSGRAAAANDVCLSGCDLILVKIK
jgi:hypothetical protein